MGSISIVKVKYIHFILLYKLYTWLFLSPRFYIPIFEGILQLRELNSPQDKYLCQAYIKCSVEPGVIAHTHSPSTKDQEFKAYLCGMFLYHPTSGLMPPLSASTSKV